MPTLEEYTDSLRIMQQMAEVVVGVGEKALEDWAKEYERKVHQRISAPRTVDQFITDGKCRAGSPPGENQMLSVDFEKE